MATKQDRAVAAVETTLRVQCAVEDRTLSEVKSLVTVITVTSSIRRRQEPGMILL